MAINREHTWPVAVLLAMAISGCICVDILQHAAPLPFLPQHLEAHGHDSLEIAAVMGSYYWSGFAGGLIITAVQCHSVLFGRFEEANWKSLRSHVLKLMAGLLLGGATLIAEAEAHQMDDYMTMQQVHLACRMSQGFLGSFLFFYAYLLSVECFTGPQQVFALTSTTVSLNVAEVFGPFIGSAIFTAYGLGMTYYVLGVLSILNNGLLMAAYYMMPTDEDETAHTDDIIIPQPVGERTYLLSASPSATPVPPSPALPRVHADLPETAAPKQGTIDSQMGRLMSVMTNRMLLASLICIAPAAMVKSSMESVLPLFGSNQGFDEFEVGQLFTLVAVGFIVAATSLGYAWTSWAPLTRHCLVAFSLIGLGSVAWIMLFTYGVDQTIPLASWVHWFNGGHHYLFYGTLVIYGVLLGVTHTAPALYLGEVLEEMEEDANCKSAANGIWNTGWEAGGSLGFLVAGYADVDSWRQEQGVLSNLGTCLFVAAGLFMLMAFSIPQKDPEKLREHAKGHSAYGIQA